MKEKIKENKTKIIGWYSKSTDHFLCVDCFSETQSINKKNYKLVEENSLEKDIYTCDKCGERFELENKVRIKKDGEEEKVAKDQKSQEEEKKGCLGCGLVILFVILAVIIIAVFSGGDDSALESERSERMITARICFNNCKWDSGHQMWKHSWVSKYFLTRDSCIDWCLRINE